MKQNNKWKSVLSKTSGIVFLALGTAFLVGSLLAYIQNILSQIPILASVGMACLMIGVILLFWGLRMKKNTKSKNEY